MIVAPRPHCNWTLGTHSVELGARTLIAGVVNVTPDSFSDAGRFLSTEKALAHALALLEQGADLLDIGGESTRPGTRPVVSAEEEQDRVLPVLEALRREKPDAILSIDTYKAATARAALTAGAEIVNDVSGFLWDAELAEVCARSGCGVILMHTRGRPQDWKHLPPLAPNRVVPLVLHELEERVSAAREAGIAPSQLVLDPGFGFGKIGEENYPLMAHLDAFHALGLPLLAGPSRKSFLGRTLAPLYGRAPVAEQRDTATLAALTAAVLAGAHIVRVHAVSPAREAVAIADAIRDAASPSV